MNLFFICPFLSYGPYYTRDIGQAKRRLHLYILSAKNMKIDTYSCNLILLVIATLKLNFMYSENGSISYMAQNTKTKQCKVIIQLWQKYLLTISLVPP